MKNKGDHYLSLPKSGISTSAEIPALRSNFTIRLKYYKCQDLNHRFR